MRSAAKSLGVLFVLAVLAGSEALAVPNRISYQGALHNQSGSPVNGLISITFSLFSAATGGTALWTETQDLTVSNGIFSVELGAVTPISSSMFGSDSLYLAIKVGADQEMSPRQRLTTAAYSYRAEMLSPPLVPIGGIVAWHKSMTGTPSLPVGWVECSGQVLDDPASPYNGQVIPNLNATGLMLAGNTSSGTTAGHSHTFNTGDELPNRYNIAYNTGGSDRHHHSGTTNGGGSAFTVVFIMRVK